MATSAPRALSLQFRPRLRPVRLVTGSSCSCSSNSTPIGIRELSRSSHTPIPSASNKLAAAAMRGLTSTTPRLKGVGQTLGRGNSRTRYFSASSAMSSSPPTTSSKHVYNVAASYIAKGIPNFDPSTHVFHFNPYNRVQPPKPGGRSKSTRPASGQDAFFVSRLGTNPGEVALGVADGVGGWMDSGVDPADFSHAFCEYMAAAAYEHKPTPPGNNVGAVLTARQLMQRGYEAVCHDGTIKAGGSTALVALLEEGGRMEVANLGDSGFIILRLNGVHAASEPQIHAFNTPFQLSVVPPLMLLRAAAFGGAQLMDQPRDAEVSQFQLKHGDVVVFATDGLWDNLFNQDILRIVSRRMIGSGAWTATDAGVQVAADLAPFAGEQEPANSKNAAAPSSLQSILATEIVAAARSASKNARLEGPFAKEVKKYYPHEVWQGGKEDDICAVVVLVSEEQAPMKAKL